MRPRHAPPWLFAVTSVPFGTVGGFVATTMPYLTREAGISVESFGWYNLATFIPPILQFLYAPIVDIGPSRRVWLVLVSILGGACLCGSMLMPLPDHAGAFLAFAVAAQLISGLVGSCNGGLLASTLPNELRGAAGGWLNVGNLGGGALGSWISIEMIARKVAPLWQGMALAGLMAVTSLAALAIVEPPRTHHRPPREVFGHMVRDVWKVLRSRQGYTGILFCFSPVGTAALINYFSGLAKDYQASPGMVAFVNGPVNGLLTAGGSLLGGYLCDRVNRRAMYLVSGALTAACGIAMALAPISPSTYAYGVSAYLFISGLCYAAFSAVVLEAVGTAGETASTQYTLFTSAANAAIAYTGFFDSQMHQAHGVRGLLFLDAGLNVGGILVLSLMLVLVLRRRPAATEAA